MKQHNLAQMLVEELTAMGAEEITYDKEHCYVYATIPASVGYEKAPVLGFIAHMDTSPAVTGTNVNPRIVESEGEQVGDEGCLSVPGKYGLVKRPYYAKVRAQDRNGEWFEAEGEELIGRCFCHELDHLDGIVYTQVMERFLTEEELQFDED
jgi:peptide deformylase